IMLAPDLRAVDRTFVGVQRPLDPVFGKAKLAVGSSVIDDDGVDLTRCRSQYAADHLPIEPELLRGTREDATSDLGHIPALGQHHAVDDDVNLSTPKASQGLVTLGFGRRAVDVVGFDTGLDELVADVDGMSDVDREDHRLPALAVLEPMYHDVADQPVG